MTPEPTLAERFVQALATKDRDTLTSLLRPDVDLRALTPSRFWECAGYMPADGSAA